MAVAGLEVLATTVAPVAAGGGGCPPLAAVAGIAAVAPTSLGVTAVLLADEEELASPLGTLIGLCAYCLVTCSRIHGRPALRAPSPPPAPAHTRVWLGGVKPSMLAWPTVAPSVSFLHDPSSCVHCSTTASSWSGKKLKWGAHCLSFKYNSTACFVAPALHGTVPVEHKLKR